MPIIRTCALLARYLTVFSLSFHKNVLRYLKWFIVAEIESLRALRNTVAEPKDESRFPCLKFIAISTVLHGIPKIVQNS